MPLSLAYSYLPCLACLSCLVSVMRIAPLAHRMNPASCQKALLVCGSLRSSILSQCFSSYSIWKRHSYLHGPLPFVKLDGWVTQRYRSLFWCCLQPSRICGVLERLIGNIEFELC